jgi:hypothetical protein
VKPGKEVAEILKEWLDGPPPPVTEKPASPPPPNPANSNRNGGASLNGTGNANGSLPPDLVAIWKRMCSPRGVIEEFTKLKEAITQAGGGEGQAGYREILRRHGVESPNEFKSSQPARLCAKELYQAIQEFEQLATTKPCGRADTAEEIRSVMKGVAQAAATGGTPDVN